MSMWRRRRPTHKEVCRLILGRELMTLQGFPWPEYAEDIEEWAKDRNIIADNHLADLAGNACTSSGMCAFQCAVLLSVPWVNEAEVQQREDDQSLLDEVMQSLVSQ